MADLTINTRDLNFLSANVKVKFRHPDTGKPTVFTVADITGTAALATELGNIMAPDANTVEEIKATYVKSGGATGDVLAVSTSVWANVYTNPSEEIDYNRTTHNGNIFLDVTA